MKRLNPSPDIHPCQKDRSTTSSAKKVSRPASEVSVSLRGESLQRLLTTDDIAALFGIAPATVVWWRSQRQGPPWVRLGRGKRAPVRYRQDAVEAYIAEMESAAS